MDGNGMHLMVDGYGCDRNTLEDMLLIYNFMDAYPSQMGMTKIMPPYVFCYRSKVPEDMGISGFVLIGERGHVSIHTFPQRQCFSLDMFSCEPFDMELAVKIVKLHFNAEKYEVRILEPVPNPSPAV